MKSPVVSVPNITPLSLIVTSPLVTEKLSDENDATPLLDVLASSPENVKVPLVSS